MTHSTAELAGFLADTGYDDIPKEVRDVGTRLMTDAVGCALAGFRTPVARRARDVAAAMGGPPEASAILWDDRIAAASAAFANTIAGRADLYDDTYGVGHIHAGVAQTFTSLAMCERAGADSAAALRAFVLGAEISARVSRAVGEEHYLAGFHNSGTVVVFGTAAAASCVANTAAAAHQAALSLAGDHAAGLRQYQIDGSPANSALHAANAAKNGIWAALLAQAGFPAPAAMLEGERGFLHAFAPAGDPGELTRGLGTEWIMTGTGIKAFPGCRGTHAPVAAIDDLIIEHSFSAGDVARVDVFQKELEIDLCSRPLPESELDAHFSTQYAVARMLVRRSLGPGDYDPECLADPDVGRVQGIISIAADPSLEGLPGAAARVEVTLHDGRRFARQLDVPRGEPEHPMTAAQLARKFLAAATLSVDEPQAEEVLQLCSRIGDDALPVTVIGAALRATAAAKGQ
jgi:2-methylcitrate dehydratase PrpD